MDKVIDKIRKLLALAESPMEHEAHAALLKARQLMVEHKLRDEDIQDVTNIPVIQELSGITCSKRKNSWAVNLSTVIAEHYCCQAYRSRKIGKQTVHIGFIGLKDDFEICNAIFKYAFDCIESKCRELRKEHKNAAPDYLTQITDAYGNGFAKGVHILYKQQTAEHQEYALVLVTPVKVKEIVDKMKTSVFKKADYSGDNHKFGLQGQEDGKKFDPSTKLSFTNVFWGFEPQTDGSYCNVDMETGTVSHMLPSDTEDLPFVAQTFKLSEIVTRYSAFDIMIRQTVDKFSKAHPQLFNKFINEM